MEQDEALRKESQVIQQRLQQEKTLIDSEKKAAEAEVTKDREILTELQRQRETLIQSVESSVLNTYRQISKFRKGIVLARAAQDSCQACHVRIRPHMVSQVMAGTDHHLRQLQPHSVLEAGCSLRSHFVDLPLIRNPLKIPAC